jgi:lysine biosynthesis protein LysW
MKKAKCPSCKSTVELQEETKVQELVTCPHCTALLELVSKSPPTLDWAEDPAVNSSRRILVKLF